MPKRFVNTYLENHHRKIRHFVKWFFGAYDEITDKRRSVPDGFQVPFCEHEVVPSKPKVTWINHSTFLIEVEGRKILTDPIWSKRCSPFRFFGPKRKHQPPISIDDLERVDYVVISHNHYDHLDRKTVRFLHQKFPGILWFVPLGLKVWFIKQDIYNVVELNWWDEYSVKEKNFEMRVVGVPAQHFSGRKLFDLDRTLWAGFVVEVKNKRFYFAGDTGYNEHDFKKLGDVFKKIDLSLIPIGAYLPRKFQSPVHVGPKEALDIHKEVKSKLSVACHWHTFKLSYEDQLRPAFDLLEALDKSDVHNEEFRILYPGQSINW
ncbi:MAG: hypothetical protein K940chlam8_00035 [Chlamydiae bacterium]|nr:hypothetical protein [Chlamydiota bacterium]